MNSEQTWEAAGKFLLHIYQDDVVICAKIATAVKDENLDYICGSLDEIIKFCEKLKEGLKRR